MGKSNFSMIVDDVDKEIMDFVADVVYEDYKFSKSDVVALLFKECAIEYLGLGFEFGSPEFNSLSSSMLLSLLKQQKLDNDLLIIRRFGVEGFKKIISELKENGLDASHFENLLQIYLEKEGE